MDFLFRDIEPDDTDPPLCRPNLEGRKFNHLVTIKCGEREFLVHSDVLCASSSHFRIFYLNEGPNGRLEDERLGPNLGAEYADAFQVYVNWLYSGQLHLAVESAEYTDETGHRGDAIFDKWTLCYKFGIKHDDHVFLDACIDALVALMVEHDYIPIAIINSIFSPQSYTGSLSEDRRPHKQMILDAILHTAEDLGGLSAFINDSTSEPMLIDVFSFELRLKRHNGVQRVSLAEFFDGVEACKYHLHRHPRYYPRLYLGRLDLIQPPPPWY